MAATENPDTACIVTFGKKEERKIRMSEFPEKEGVVDPKEKDAQGRRSEAPKDRGLGRKRPRTHLVPKDKLLDERGGTGDPAAATSGSNGLGKGGHVEDSAVGVDREEAGDALRRGGALDGGVVKLKGAVRVVGEDELRRNARRSALAAIGRKGTEETNEVVLLGNGVEVPLSLLGHGGSGGVLEEEREVRNGRDFGFQRGGGDVPVQ